MKHDPQIHSQVHPASEKPVHIGWYRSCIDFDSEEAALLIDEETVGAGRFVCMFWWYWNGDMWMASEHTLAGIQTRRWFGLREQGD